MPVAADVRRLVARLVLVAALVVSFAGVVGPAPVAEAAATQAVVITGHGFGHGRGLGQYGALGSAIDLNLDASSMLDDYYSNTWMANIGTPDVTVRLLANDGADTIVFQRNGNLAVANVAPGPGPVVRLVRVGSGQFQIFDGPSCTGPWTQRPGTVPAPGLRVQLTVAPATVDDLLQLCTGGGLRGYRGDLLAYDAGSSQATVNQVPVESYLRGVVPRESPASWAGLGSGKGMEALKAQAVAARSYALAENRTSFAQTCDTTFCQVYGGASFTPAGSATTYLEDPRTDAAVSATAGLVRRFFSSGTPLARTEFSSSTGGYTAGGTFPAVPDDGDAVSVNPNHNWSRTVSLATLSAQLGVGQVVSIQVTSTNGLGAGGGRALQVTVRTTSGSVVLSGVTVQARLGLLSNWFSFSLQNVDTGPGPAGGYRLDPDGHLAPYGTAPAATVTGVAAGTARAVAVGGPNHLVGQVLTSDGAAHPFNGAPTLGGGPSWNFDAGRDIGLRADGTSGYVLDLLGGVWPIGGAPPPSPGVSQYRSNGLARRLVIRQDGVSGYVLFADGVIGTFGAAPPVGNVTLGTGRTAVGLLLQPDGRSVVVVDDSGALIRSDGTVLAAGGAAGAVAAAAGRLDGSGYAVTPAGATVAVLGAPAVTAATAAASTVDLALVPELAGYTLDFAGALHPFGGAPSAVLSAYFNGQDLARGVAVGPLGVGWVLDAYGGIHAFGTVGNAAPSSSGVTASWPGWDIARGIALLPGRSDAGYVLDGYGGVHSFGGAPTARNGVYFGFDIARGIALLPDGTGGYVLDGWGGVHPFSIGANPVPASGTGAAYWKGWDIARSIVVTAPGRGVVLDGWGGSHGFGGYSAASSYVVPNSDCCLGLALDPGSGWVAFADRSGGVHTLGATPSLVPSATWSANVVRGAAVLSR